MASPIFAIPLNLGLGTWFVITISCIGFIVMFGLSSALGDYQGLIKTTLKNDASSRAAKKTRR
tara:strand:- start:291 stop:479 length:189 start_codon:yes stop_codon:yes gene_type:complete